MIAPSRRRDNLKKEIDLRDQFDEIVLGKNGRIAHQQKVLLRSARRDSKGALIKCACVSKITKEPDQENECRFCLGEGHIWDEKFIYCYSALIGADGGKGNRTKRIIPGEVRTDYKVFYLRYDEKISYNDKIIVLSLDLEGNVVIPYKRETIYRPETIQAYRSDNGRLEYYAVYCREESSVRENI